MNKYKITFRTCYLSDLQSEVVEASSKALALIELVNGNNVYQIDSIRKVG